MFSATPFTSQCMNQSIGTSNTFVTTLVQTLLAAQCAISPPDIWPRDFGPTFLEYGVGTYDFIIIGAGTAGSVLASRLSENPSWSVLVLEAGGDPPIESEIPGVFFNLQHTKYNWNYYTELDGKSCLAYRNQVCYWPRGKMIGGTGAINGMLYVRGNLEDYDSWARKGNSYWSWQDVFPYFEKSLQWSDGNSSNTNGRTSVNSFELSYPEIREMLFAGAEEYGIPRVNDIKEGADIGFTTLKGNVEHGLRSSTGKSYLAKAKNRPNLHVIKNALVTKINFDETGSHATGVNFIYDDNHHLTASIAKEVVLSAGALDSPKILMLSGIGPENHLKNFGIPVMKNLRVGDNLQDHLIIPLFFKINHRKVKPQTFKEELDASYNFLTAQTGPHTAHGTLSVAGFINSDIRSDSPYPDIIFHHVFMQSGSASLDSWLNAVGMSDNLADSLRLINQKHNILTVYVVLLRPKSIGTLRLRSANPRDPPKLFANYLEHPEDIETLLRGINFQMQMELTKAYREQEAQILQLPLPECDQYLFKSRDYWTCYMKYMSNTVYHMAGTVKMGPDSDRAAVLDWRLHVKGVKGLRVADASIMPDVISGNTNAPTIMIAERAADFIKEAWGQGFEQFIY